MDYLQIRGKTREEAIQKAIKELKVEEEKLDIQVIDEGSKGFLGIGAKDYVINVRKLIDKNDIIRDFLQKIFASIKVNCDIQILQDEDTTRVNIIGEEASILIGRRGESLDSLQLLVNIVVTKELNSYEKIILDIENYREKREQSLISYAKKMARKVMMQRRSIKLEPMNPYERRVIHYALQEDTKINTFSEGEEPNRRIVISVKRNSNNDKARYLNKYNKKIKEEQY